MIGLPSTSPAARGPTPVPVLSGPTPSLTGLLVLGPAASALATPQPAPSPTEPPLPAPTPVVTPAVARAEAPVPATQGAPWTWSGPWCRRGRSSCAACARCHRGYPRRPSCQLCGQARAEFRRPRGRFRCAGRRDVRTSRDGRSAGGRSSAGRAGPGYRRRLGGCAGAWRRARHCALVGGLPARRRPAPCAGRRPLGGPRAPAGRRHGQPGCRFRHPRRRLGGAPRAPRPGRPVGGGFGFARRHRRWRRARHRRGGQPARRGHRGQRGIRGRVHATPPAGLRRP